MKEYSDSVTSKSSGYKANASIGGYECNEGSNSVNNYTSVNRGFAPDDIPTSQNSKHKTDSSQLSPNQDSPAKTGNLSC